MQLAKLPRLYKLLKILRLLKLVRLLKYSRSVKKILQAFNMNQGVKRMTMIAMTMFFLVHLVGCVFFLSSKLLDFPDDSWVIRYDMLDYDPPR